MARDQQHWGVLEVLAQEAGGRAHGLGPQDPDVALGQLGERQAHVDARVGRSRSASTFQIAGSSTKIQWHSLPFDAVWAARDRHSRSTDRSTERSKSSRFRTTRVVDSGSSLVRSIRTD
jgi:hypothetical protein